MYSDLKEIYTVIFEEMFREMFMSEAATGCFYKKKVFIEILRNSQENSCARVFFNRVTSLRPATLLKRDTGTGAFL